MVLNALAPAPAARILIVEDEAVVALDLQGALEALGYVVIGVADSAEAALVAARRGAPALALMDIALRGAADGISAAEALRRETGTPVIFLTSFSDTETVGRAARAGAYGYLTKPFQAKELRAGIEVALWKSRMERELREADRWFALTLRCVQDGVVVVDTADRVRFLNLAAEALTGWTQDEAQGRPVREVVCYGVDGVAGAGGAAGVAGAARDTRFGAPGVADAASGQAPPTAQALGQRRVVGVRYGRALRYRGAAVVTPVDESAAPVHDDAGALLGAVLVLRDARERLHQQALLRSSEARFRSVFEAAPLGMAVVALDGGFLQVNPALCTLLGRSAAALLTRTQAELSHPDDLAHEAERLAALQGSARLDANDAPGAVAPGQPEVTQFEKRYLRAPDGLPVWVLVHASPLPLPLPVSPRDAAQRGRSPAVDDAAAQPPAAWLYQVHDTTAQRAAAAELARLGAERIHLQAGELASRSRQQFLSRISHEMRTPLNAVLGFAQLLKMQQSRGQLPDARYSEHILTAGRHLLALVDDVLDLQRADDGTLRLAPSPIALETSLPAMVALLGALAETRGVEVTTEVQAGLVLHADETRLRQVVLNLGSNAIKYNRRGGRVRVLARTGAGTPAAVELEVSDTGIGMSPEQLEHLFEPFNRLGREGSTVPGTGLGMLITRSLVQQMGGTLRLASEPSGGTTVIVAFPAAVSTDVA